MNERYSRQVLFEGIGKSGQELLRGSRAAIVGAGALGTAQAEMLARAGVGKLKIADRDFVEASNLQRQTMFTERDADDRLPKAVACEKHIAEINSDIEVEGIVADINNSNIENLIKDCDVVLDGTDNFATRYLVNEACVKHHVNWIYGAAVGAYGVTMTVRPGISPCLRCLFDEPPPPGSAPTCDTAGVVMPIIATVASIQVIEAIKLLTSQYEALHRSLLQFDLWRNDWRRIALRDPIEGCLTCDLHEFVLLDTVEGEFAAALCGRDAVQVVPTASQSINLETLAARLRPLGEVKINDYLLRFRVGDHELTVFRDARAIIRGTTDIASARSLYARFIGN
jgi:molybdopterin/thiamine biosynthesis adenylyltransferase